MNFEPQSTYIDSIECIWKCLRNVGHLSRPQSVVNYVVIWWGSEGTHYQIEYRLLWIDQIALSNENLT